MPNDKRILISTILPNMADVPDYDSEVTLPSGIVITERDFDFMVISLYKKYPVLWEVKNKSYKDKNKRSAALQCIVKSLQSYKPEYTEDKLKKKINSLRTNFNKERNKLFNKSNRSGVSVDDVAQPRLWYYKELLFLSEQNKRDSEQVDEEHIEQSHFQQIKRTPKTKIKKLNEDLNVLPQTNYFKEDEFDVITKCWALKLNRLAHDQRRYAEKIINDVLFEGEMGALTRNGVRFLPASFPEFYSSPSHSISTSPRPKRIYTEKLAQMSPSELSMQRETPSPH